MKQLLILFFALLVSNSLFCQLEDVKIETKNGQKVYVHIIQKGNTLWGLHRLYDVDVETIIASNPGVENGLKEGETIYIPIPIITKEQIHTVVAGETLYAISKKYGVKVEDLIAWNPGCDKGLDIGQKLKIKTTSYITGGVADSVAVEQKELVQESSISVTFDDSVVIHTVLKGETMYSISRRYLVSAEKIRTFNDLKNNKIRPGDKLKIPLKKENIKNVEVRKVPDAIPAKPIDSTLLFPTKDSYRIAILMPFMLDKGVAYSETISRMATEFYMGAKLAIDSLEKNGLKATVFVYDSENSANKIQQILAKPELKTMDLVIGPLNKAHAQQLADWCLKHKIRMVCPVNVDTKILKNNPLVYTTIGSDITLMRGMANYLANQFEGARIILIKPTLAQDSVLFQAFRMEYNHTASSLNGRKLIVASPESALNYLSESTEVALVYPTNNSKSAVTFLNKLSTKKNKLNEHTRIYGTEAWFDMEGISASYRSEFKLTTPASLDLNYQDERTKMYIRKYRSTYGSYFSKIAIQGFDVMYNFCSELLLKTPVGKLIMNDFESVQVGRGNGYENQRVEIITNEDYTLKNLTNGSK